MELSDGDKVSADKIKEKLQIAFGDDPFIAYDKLLNMKWAGEPVDVFANELKRLARLAMHGEAGLDGAIKLSFIKKFPDHISVDLKRIPKVLKLEISELIAQARILTTNQRGGVAAVTVGEAMREKQSKAGSGQFRGQCFRCGRPHMIRNCNEQVSLEGSEKITEPNLSDPPVGRIATNVLTSYLDRVWALSEEEDPHFPLIKLCKAHFIKNIAVNAKAKYPKLKPKQRRLIMTYFAVMIEAQGKNELYATFRDFVQLIQSPWSEEDIETLIEHYKNSETPALDLNFVEPTHALIVEDVGRYRDKCAVGKKFEAVAEEVMKEKYLPGTKENEYYSLEFMEYVLTYCMPFTPLWCGIQGGTKTNGLVEGWHKIIKLDILQKKRITLPAFVTTMYKQTKARTIESAHDYKIVKKKSTSKIGDDHFVERWCRRKLRSDSSYGVKIRKNLATAKENTQEKEKKNKSHVADVFKVKKIRCTAAACLRITVLGYGSGTNGYRLYDFNAKRILLSRDVVFNESQFVSFEKEPSKEIECVPCSLPQEEKHEDSEGELELRRSTRNRAAPDRFGEWACFAQDKFDVPANVEEALHGPESKLWKAAMEEEMVSMNINNIWSLVECPKNKKPIRCKWIFKRKTGPDGNVCSYKARLIAQGMLKSLELIMMKLSVL
ncbi:Reverse transcriptase RNA-dependent DNA polymerase [Trinorchestia longiramus]|nr:Reverse transcriptase RNA-dependent DNA polymerase [Trinorchestia longiramus]